MNIASSIQEWLEAFVGLIKIFWWLIPILLAYWITGRMLDKRKANRRSKVNFSKYKLRKSVLTKNELDFYHCLKSVLGEEPVILSKVRLADIFYTKSGSGYYKALNRITGKHVDFLLCDPNDFKPFMAIEVDDRSHERKDRIKRDDFVNQLFKAMKIPILRYKAEKTYLIEDVKDQVSILLSEHYFDKENNKDSTM